MRAGDLVMVDFGVPIGSEAGFTRPAVVLTADAILDHLPRVLHLVPVTGTTSRAMPTEVVVSAPGLDRASVAQCHLVTAVSRQRVGDEDLGNIGPAALAEVREVVRDLLDLP